ncbi:putative SP-containing membrane protein [Vairimorpha necatrix]|uniref:SP-containing membrane protein n=1 Tax=Vairimorpha necatrix TaxID=6039 RepID=A0AAX4JDP8_9MICR
MIFLHLLLCLISATKHEEDNDSQMIQSIYGHSNLVTIDPSEMHSDEHYQEKKAGHLKFLNKKNLKEEVEICSKEKNNSSVFTADNSFKEVKIPFSCTDKNNIIKTSMFEPIYKPTTIPKDTNEKKSLYLLSFYEDNKKMIIFLVLLLVFLFITVLGFVVVLIKYL